MKRPPAKSCTQRPRGPVIADQHNPENAASVLVAEDFEDYRRFIAASLDKQRSVRIVGEATDGMQAVQKALELKPDIILMDIGMPNLNGIEAARQILASLPESKILFLSQELSKDIALHALGIGARGYVVKSQAAKELVPAIETVLKGERFVSRVLGLNGASTPKSSAAHSE